MATWRQRNGKRFRNRLFGAGAALVALAVVAGCGSSDDGDDGGSGGESADVAFLTYSNDGLYIPKEVQGIENVIGPDGGSVEIFDAKLDAQAQLAQCQDVITSQRFNMIVLQPVDPATAGTCAEDAAAADIPVVALEFPVGPDPSTLEPQVDGVVGTVAGTTEGQAEKVYEGIKAGCKGVTDCEVALEVPARADPLGAAMIEAVETNGPADGIKLVAVTEGLYDIAETAKTLPDVLSANPDLDVFMAEADTNALAAVPVIDDAGLGDQVKVMGLGGSTAMIAAIEEGTAFGTVAYWPETAGEVVGEMIQATLNGEQIEEQAVDFQTVNPDQPLVVTQENVSEFIPEWGE